MLVRAIGTLRIHDEHFQLTRGNALKTPMAQREPQPLKEPVTSDHD